MKPSGRNLTGLIILSTGIIVLFGVLNLGALGVALVAFFFGMNLWRNNHKVGGVSLVALGAIIFFNGFLNIDIGGVIIAVLMVYIGFRLLRRDGNKDEEEKQWTEWYEEDFRENTDAGVEAVREKKQMKWKKKRKEKSPHHKHRKTWKLEDDIDEEIEKLIYKMKNAFSSASNGYSEETHFQHTGERTHREPNSASYRADHPGEDERHEKQWEYDDKDNYQGQQYTKQYRKQRNSYRQEVSSLLGDFILRHRFELHDMKINNGLGDVKIDLSQAIIAHGDTTVEIFAGLGDVQLYVPYDLDVCVQASVLIGTLDVLNYKQDGFTRRTQTKSAGYDEATKRVNIVVTLGIGDVDVRYV
ncbi:Cell wall-active antibiotics response 4TMS YvqF [Desulfotomaculum arcticum]|uniref:Cell wall-active antibiotics response 4TMS YvqF n=1 Tax=Desulfotruncus arcticus DSM 17038 TaxID=1121424 RepID=A0A1I2RD91_9FIRM|nr:cell wall-active antibiotics response protein LiaF [Desulfotruncus arcticus]SFG38442.1 Cell wall-active antibiotics response 4TMS YvqF [Desulfotomaculum arcticum] [Desulfotruncus arcticus DSM 17038]